MKLLKTLAIMAMLFTTPALAQTASPTDPATPATAALPGAPSAPSIIATSPNQNNADSMSTTNDVYINQSGDNVNINIKQTGQTNIFGTFTDPVYLRGANQSIIGIQTGNNNEALISVVSGTAGTDNASLSLQQIGNSNYALIRCGSSLSDASCTGLNFNARFTGDSNSLNYHGAGANITTTLDITGGNNSLTMSAISPNASQTILVSGDYNTLNTTQTDLGGTYGHSLYVNLTGTGNAITTQQYGATETVINVTSVGNNGNVNIKTGH